MKSSLVILFAVVVAVVSAARLPVANSRPSLDKLEPVLQKIVDHLRETRSGLKSEDVFDNEGFPENSVEEFRQKPMNWKALMEKVEYLENQQQNAAETKDNEDSEDSDVFLSYGLDKPVKMNEVKNEIDGDEEDEVIDMAKEDNLNVLISYGLPEPIEASDMKKSIVEEDDDDDDEDEKENESIIPFGEINDDDNEELDDEDIQVSFGLAEPIKAAAAADKINQQEDAEADADDDEEDDEKPSDLNEKVMSEVISNVLAKFAKAYNVKL